MSNNDPIIKIGGFGATTGLWQGLGVAAIIIAYAHSCVTCFGPNVDADNAAALRITCTEIDDPIKRAECLKPLFEKPKSP